MAFTYDIAAKNKDKHSSKCIMVCHLFESVIGIFASTFFVAHIFSLSADVFDYIKNAGIYYLVTYLVFMATNFFVSYIVDRTKRVGVFRLSLMLRLIMVLVMIFFGKDLVSLLPLAGFLYGFSGGCYYASYNVLKQEMVSRKNMGDFATFTMILSKVIEIITPIGLGAIISLASFTAAAIYVAILTGVIFIVSLFIKSQKPEESNFSFRKFLVKVKQNEEVAPKLKFLYWTGFVYGFSTAVGVIINICIMLQFNSSFSLGGITSILSAVALIEIFAFNKFTKPGKRAWIYSVLTLLPLIGSLCFVINATVVTVIIFNALMAISSIIFRTEYDVYRNSNLKEAGLYSEIAEHQVMVEMSISVPRVLSFLVIMIVGLLKSLLAFKIILVLFSLTYSLTLIMLALYEKKYLKKAAQ